jgi:hypothetical protein
MTTSRWLTGVEPRVVEAILSARDSIGVLEEPPGSNRGPEIDAWNQRAGVPAGSYWCAAAAGAWWADAGLEVPSGYASCDRWMAWAKQRGRFHPVPVAGAMVLYGVPGDARHIGLVIRVSPLILSIEGNTTVEGKGDERNGIAVALKLVTAADPVLGYVHPS